MFKIDNEEEENELDDCSDINSPTFDVDRLFEEIKTPTFGIK